LIVFSLDSFLFFFYL